MELRFVDLFCGIGGFHQAIASTSDNAQCVLACDIDLECQRVYAANFGIRPFGDIKVLTEGEVVDVPEHDLLCAGFPCQPFSKSGRQLGIGETRGTLFFNILKVLEARRPRYVILENVRNLAGPRHRDTWATIIRNLRLLGYRVATEPTIVSPHRLSPAQGGTPQVRERVFILAEHVGTVTSSDGLVAAPLEFGIRDLEWSPASWSIDQYLESEASIAKRERYALRPTEVEWLDTWNELLQSLPADRLPGFPIWADAFVERPTLASELPGWKRDFLIKNSEFYRLHKTLIDKWLARHGGLKHFPASRRKFEWQAQNAVRDIWQLVVHLRPSGIRVKRGTYVPALVAITQTSIIGWRRRRITPREAARLQGFPDSFQLHPSDAIAYRQLGNAVNVGVVAGLARHLLSVGLSPQPDSGYAGVQEPLNLAS